MTRCNEVGVCEDCTAEERRTEEYCKKSGRKMKIYCLGSLAEENDYKACDNEENNLIEVIQFQVIVALIGSFAFWHNTVKSDQAKTNRISRLSKKRRIDSSFKEPLTPGIPSSQHLQPQQHHQQESPEKEGGEHESKRSSRVRSVPNKFKDFDTSNSSLAKL